VDGKRSDSGDEPAAAASAPNPVGEVVRDGTPPEVLIERMVVPRWIQAVMLPLALIGLYELARASGPVVPIIAIATIVALILNPLVKRLARVMPHGLAILGAYLVVVVLFAGVAVVIFDPIAGEINHFATNLPSLTHKANTELDSIQTWLDSHGVKVHIQQQGQTALQTVQKAVLKRSNSIVSFSKSVLSTLVTLSIYGLLTLVLSIYLLIYARRIGELFRRWMPPGSGAPEDDYPLLVQKAVTGYVRGQVTLMVIMGVATALVMWIFGVTGIFPDGSRFALFFGAFYGLMELIPYVGPIIGPLPALAVALFSDPISAIWVLIASIALQEAEGHIIAPQVFRISLRINPILVILALLVGEEIWGVVGALMALPLATIIRQTGLYLRDHLVLEPWTRLPPAPPA
jgi:predicted PurR-regulated permease PerM